MDPHDPFGPASESEPERLGLENFDLIAKTGDPGQNFVERLDFEEQVECSAGSRDEHLAGLPRGVSRPPGATPGANRS